jgi:hypothetical protein
MALIRFVTARDVFDAFATAQQDVNAEPNDMASLEYLQTLADRGELNKAVSFCAYLLPRREAVWWGCRCVKAMLPKLSAEEAALLKTAENWIQMPEEEQRVAALEHGMGSNPNWPSTWLALAAGWSGGNILLGIQATAQAPPQQTARAVRGAILCAVSRLAPQERDKGLRVCVEDGARIAREEVQ